MPLISCDMRYGRTDEQKRKLAAGLIRAVGQATGEPRDNIFFVIREGRGVNFVEHGEHLPEYVENAAADSDLIERLKDAVHDLDGLPATPVMAVSVHRGWRSASSRARSRRLGPSCRRC